jgi:phage virion morphogenesis protein
MALITITYDDRAELDALRELAARAVNLRPALLEIGEDLMPNTKDRFRTSTGPDGQRWAANSETTILAHLTGVKGAYGKKAGMTQKGMTALLGKKPLVQGGYLQDTLNYQVDGDTLLLGSPQPYAAVQQFGAKKGSLGKGAPWGDIPARPFLGVSDADQRSILETLGHYLVP